MKSIIDFIIKMFIYRLKSNLWIPIISIILSLASCGSPNGTMTYDDIDSAIDEWNQRVEEEIAKGRIITESAFQLDSIRHRYMMDLKNMSEMTDSKRLEDECTKYYYELESKSTLSIGIELDSIRSQMDSLYSKYKRITE